MGGFALHVLALTGAGTVKCCVWFNLLGDNPAPSSPRLGGKKRRHLSSGFHYMNTPSLSLSLSRVGDQ